MRVKPEAAAVPEAAEMEEVEAEITEGALVVEVTTVVVVETRADHLNHLNSPAVTILMTQFGCRRARYQLLTTSNSFVSTSNTTG